MEKSGAEVKSYLFWGIIAGIIILSYFLLKTLLIAIVTAIIFAFISLPLKNKIQKKIKNEKISAIITVLIVLTTLILIFLFFVTSLINQAIIFLNRENLESLTNLISGIINSDIIRENLNAIISEVGKVFISKIPSTISYFPILVLNAFVVFFTMYYLLIDWDKLEKRVLDIIPFQNKKLILDKIKSRTNSIVSGTLFIALLELLVALIFLKVLGVGPYLILAFAIGILAFIPAIGPAVIWIPLAIVQFLYGKIGVMIGVLIMGFILSTLIDFILRAKILGNRTNTHPVIMLLGILGGISLFGFIGIIIGPLILSILATIIESLPKEH
jgi:predicted PurR-regulated permease PerM